MDSPQHRAKMLELQARLVLCRKRARSALQSLGDHRQVPSQTTLTQQHRDDSSPVHGDHDLPCNAPICRLPNELIFWIMDFLEEEYQLLFGLSCRRFRSCIDAQRIKLSRFDRETRLRFLRYLEPDYPEMLTCRPCGYMFEWASQSGTSGYERFSCPHWFRHSQADRTKAFGWTMRGTSSTTFSPDSSKASGWTMTRVPSITVSPEVVDLVHRARERGASYGLPLSILTTSRESRNGQASTNEAKFVNGQLMIASTTQAELAPSQVMGLETRFFFLYSDVCIHHEQNTTKLLIWQPLEHLVISGRWKEHIEHFKCPFCRTDCNFLARPGPNGRIRVTLKVWRSYGTRNGNTLANEQIFHQRPTIRIDRRLLSQRDLQGLYESTGAGSGEASAMRVSRKSLPGNTENLFPMPAALDAGPSPQHKTRGLRQNLRQKTSVKARTMPLRVWRN